MESRPAGRVANRSTPVDAADMPARKKRVREANATPSSSCEADDASSSDANLQAVAAAFEVVDAYSTARDAKKKQRAAGVFMDGLQYGEVDLDSFSLALSWCSPRTGERFIDLGSGSGATRPRWSHRRTPAWRCPAPQRQHAEACPPLTTSARSRAAPGKAVLAAAALHPFAVAAGVEIVPELHALAVGALGRCRPALRTETAVELHCGDAIEHPWQDYDVVFVSLTCFTDEQIARVAERARGLRAGARLLVTSRALDDACGASGLPLRQLKRERLPYGRGALTFIAYERT